MKVTIDEESHFEHVRTLLDQLAKDMFGVLERHLTTQEDKRKAIAHELLFQFCAVLDGSGHAGVLHGGAISPFVGFYLGDDTENVLVPEHGSAMHEFVSEIVDEHFSPNARNK